MGEEFVVVGGEVVSYNGLFKSRDLLNEINHFLTSKGYDKAEKKQEEKVTAKGKKVALEVEYAKSPSDYVKYVIEIDINIDELKDVVVTKGSRKMKYNEGDIKIKIKSKLKTDVAGKWKSKPMLVFAGHVINKFIYSLYLFGDSSELKSNTLNLKERIKAFLNLYKF
ncbi:hypothetical protein J4418_04205 [Candidatus Woesearchaeota archaeon]|nr:hypothetical protein [Candidatus Woesearchaeota archaeon]